MPISTPLRPNTRSYTTLVSATPCDIREYYVFEVRRDEDGNSGLVLHLVEDDFEDSLDFLRVVAHQADEVLKMAKTSGFLGSLLLGY